MHGRRRWIAAGLGVAAALAPATASAAGLIAYEFYVPGKGFEIGLKDAQTGASTSLPAAVNTAADEVHPALSRDGRFIVFTRMQLLPGLNGDFVPPEERTMQRLDRQTGAVTQISSGSIAGAAFVSGGSRRPGASPTRCRGATAPPTSTARAPTSRATCRSTPTAAQPAASSPARIPASSRSNGTLQNVLKPAVTISTKIGIFVARVTGTRKLLGRKVPKLRVVGRLPLGRARKGANRFRWDGRVAGKRLKPGTYLLTYRTLKGTRVTSTSGSIRFTIARSGRITRARRQR